MSLFYETKLIKRASRFQSCYFLFLNFLFCTGVYPVNNAVIVSISLVAQSCLTLGYPMDCSAPGFLVHHQLSELAQTCPSSQWCHPTISSSVVPFSSCLQYFPASGSFPVSQFFASGGQSIGFSIHPSSEYSGLISFRMAWLDLLAGQGTLKSLMQHHNWKAPILQHSALFIVQLSHPYVTTG